MKQSVSIARTLVHDPPVMIFDEPTSGLDVIAARDHRRLHPRMPRQGKTVLFSTHVMSEAEKLCDTIGIIHRRAPVAEGSLAGSARSLPAIADLEEIFVQAVQA